MEQIKRERAGRIGALILLTGLMVTLIALVSTPSLMAQDGVDDDGDSPVYQIRTLEEYEALPQHIKDSLPKGQRFFPASSYDLSESTKEAERSFVMAGDQIAFTVTARNSGQVDAGPLSIVDTLPKNELTYVDHTVEMYGALPDQDDPGGEKDNVVTWNGSIAPEGEVKITILAKVSQTSEVGSEITNTAVITAGDKTAEPSATITIVDENTMPVALLPVITYGEKPMTPDILSIEATRPTRDNKWTVSWNGAGAVAYELQESTSPGFENVNTYAVGPESAKDFQYEPSRYNMRYYRVRSKSGELAGNWSEILKVAGGYRDDFDYPLDNTYPFTPPMWGIRRTTNLGAVHTWNEFPGDYKWNILNISDAYELGLGSPMMEAPTVPYSIRLELKSVDPSFGLGTGFVFSGDKQTVNCPASADTTDDWYAHKDCFNQFYEFMLHEDPSGEKLNLQVKVVYKVIWNGPGDDPITFDGQVLWYKADLSGVDWGDWNAFGVDVYEDHIDIYAGRRGELRYRGTVDSIYPSNPYFGTIATTGERPKVTARYEYFEVLPIDN